MLLQLPPLRTAPIAASRLSLRSPARGNAGHRAGAGRRISLGPQCIRGARSWDSDRTRAPPRRLSKSCRRIPAASPCLFPYPVVAQSIGRSVLGDRLQACRQLLGWCCERGMRDEPSYLPPFLPDARGRWFGEDLTIGQDAEDEPPRLVSRRSSASGVQPLARGAAAEVVALSHESGLPRGECTDLKTAGRLPTSGIRLGRSQRSRPMPKFLLFGRAAR